MNSLLDDLFNRYVDAIAKARGKTADEVRALIDDAPYSAQKAKGNGPDRRRRLPRRSRKRNSRRSSATKKPSDLRARESGKSIDRLKRSRWG